MKHFLVLLFFVALSQSGFAQYNDTLYYKSGHVKAVTIRQHDEKFVNYEYGGKNGKLISNRIPIKQLKSFVVYNELNELVYDSKKPRRKEGE